MPSPPPDIQRVPGGTLVRLPLRDLPRWLGWAVLGFGVVCTVFMVSWMSGPIGDGMAGDMPLWMRMPLSGFGLLGTPMLLLGLVLLLCGAAFLVWGSRCELTIGDQALRMRERLGPLRWTWRVAYADVVALVVPRDVPVDPGEDLRGEGALHLRRRGRGDLGLMPGYDAIRRREVAGLLVAQLPELPVFDDLRAGPPPGLLREESGAQALVIELPRSRVGSILVLVAVGVATAATVFALGPDSLARLALLPGGLFAAILLAIGVPRLGERSWLRWDATGLSWERRSWLRRRVRHFPAAEVMGLRSRQHGSGSGSFRALTVTTPSAERPLHIPWLDRPSQEWIAARIGRWRRGEAEPSPQGAQRVLAALAASSDQAGDGPRALPAGSPVVISSEADALVIELPARGLGQGNPFAIGLVFAVAGLAGGAAAAWFLPPPGAVIFVTFLAAFAITGVSMAVIGLRQGTRRTRLAVDRAQVRVAQRDALGGRDVVWPRPAVRTVRAEPTGVRTNGRTHYRLAIVPHEGADLRLGEECSKAELEAVAARLRRHIG